MTNWTKKEYLDYVQKRNKHLSVENNCSTHSRKTTQFERTICNESLDKKQVQASGTGKVLIGVTSVRKRLLDTDNLAPKYFVDCLRYSGLISGDSPDKAEIQTKQRKCEKGEEEHTLVEITYL